MRLVSTSVLVLVVLGLVACGAQASYVQFDVPYKKGIVFPAEIRIMTRLGADADAVRAYNAAKAGNLDAAIAASRANTRKHPNDWRYHHNLAVYLAAAGQWDESVCTIRKAVAVANAHPVDHTDSQLSGTYGALHRHRTHVRGDETVPEHEVEPLVCPDEAKK